MSHLDEEALALAALGDGELAPADSDHLASCARCRGTLESYRSVVSTGRRVEAADRPVAPRPEVWDRVLTAVREPADRSETRPVPPPAAVPRIGGRPARPVLARRIAPLAAAAVVGLLVGSAVTWGITRDGSPTPTASSPARVTVASLRPLDDPTASGRAVLRVQSPTSRTVSITVAGLPAEPRAFYEVWLMDPSNAHLVALGVLDASGRGTFAVPSGLDLGQYSAVDVSLQPMNGSPLHSKNSAVRGSLDG